jgi:hypothetical protein
MDSSELAAAQRDASAPIPGLLRAAMTSRAAPDIMGFWSAYFRLPSWLLIARGEPGSPSPFVVVPADRPTILVFSDPRGAQLVGRAAGLSEEEASKILALPMPLAVDWVAAFAQQGVRSVQFDAHLDGGIVIPIDNLPQMRVDLLGPPSAPESDGSQDAGQTPAVSIRVTVSPSPSRSTRTVSPSRMSPASRARASLSSISCCMSRRNGRAP